jgi:phosphoenolpyruvate carboxykinase (ATP)
MGKNFSLEQYGLTVDEVIRNATPAVLYEHGLRHEPGTAISSTGAFIAMSGEKMGRSPSDKRIVEEPTSKDEVWWGPVNMPLDEEAFVINRERAIDYLNTRPRLYVVDGFAGWDERYRIKVRIVCSRAYHAIFMRNMLIRPSPEELESFGDPDYVVFNAGSFSANRHTKGMTSKTSVDLHLGRKEFVILGTQYAGEMKKGVFTIMHYIMPKQNVLSMHCSANESPETGDVSIFFGLSGTGRRPSARTRTASSSATTSTAGPTTGSSTSRAAATPRRST